MTSLSPGSKAKAKSGRPSSTRLTQRIWAGRRGRGKPKSKAPAIRITSEKESERRYKALKDGKVKTISGEDGTSPGQEINGLQYGVVHRDFRTPRLFAVD